MYNPCFCGHDYDKHAYSTQAPCTVEDCPCREFKPDHEAAQTMIAKLADDSPPTPRTDP